MATLYGRIKGRENRSEDAPPVAAIDCGAVLHSVRPVSLQSKKAAPLRSSPNPALVARLQQKLVADIDIASDAKSVLLDTAERERIRCKVEEMLSAEEGVSPLERDTVLTAVMAEIVGYGPLEPLLQDDSIQEIMVNGASSIWVEKSGKLVQTDATFSSDSHLMNVIEKILAPLGRRIDEASPMVDARLPDGSRVNVVIPPLSLSGPCITIRKFARRPLTMGDLVKSGTMSKSMAMFLEASVLSRLNIIVSGGTGSGKTTTLNVLSSFVPGDERIVTIEDAAELQLHQEHVVTLEARPPNLEGRGEVSIRNLVRNALRMRPDRIVVGEVRSGEALDMLQAMNTGHDGSLTTGHSNGPRDMLSRLETMVLMAGIDLPIRAIREQIASAIDLIIHQARFKDGSRRITHITEVQGMEGDVIVLQDIFLFYNEGLDSDGRVRGAHRGLGIRPRCYERFESSGISLSPALFE